MDKMNCNNCNEEIVSFAVMKKCYYCKKCGLAQIYNTVEGDHYFYRIYDDYTVYWYWRFEIPYYTEIQNDIIIETIYFHLPLDITEEKIKKLLVLK
jgi:hypothetical protein